jgi:hypothetical protein
MDVHAVTKQMQHLWNKVRISPDGVDGLECKQHMALALARDSYLYEKYGQQYYESHYGQWVAISLEGDVIFKDTSGELIHAATDRWGAGNYCMRRLHECPGHLVMSPQRVK